MSRTPDTLWSTGPLPGAVVTAVWMVGTVPVGTLLFDTAVAIRQRGGGVGRTYDRSTRRQEPLVGR